MPLTEYLPSLLSFAGAAILVAALRPLHALCRQASDTRGYWEILRILLVLFVVGYLLVGWWVWDEPADAVHIAGTLVFAGGSVFAWLVLQLNLRTVREVRRIAALEVEHRLVQAERRRLASIIDHTAEGIIVFDPQGRIETFNRAAQVLFGISEEEVIGARIDRFLPPPEGSSTAPTGEDPTGHLMGQGELEARRSSGETFPVTYTTNEIFIEGRQLYTCMVYDISEHKAMVEDLRRLAERDYLTGLYNRRYFMEELERTLERVRREPSRRHALLYLDLDRFKQVNDTFGHAVGDRVLREVAALMHGRTRQTDVLARLGGDEFALLAHGVGAEQADGLAESYRQLVTGYSVEHKGRRISVGCSVGVTGIEASLENKDEALQQADLACQIAKREGRDQVHVYTPRDRKRLRLFEG